MSAVLCLPACLGVSTAASGGKAPHGNASLQVWQPPAGTHCEGGPDATLICPEMLSSLLTLTPAGFTPEQGLTEGLNEVQTLTGTTPESSNPESPSDEWGYANSISILLAPSGSIATQAGI